MTYLENSKQYTGSDLENIFFRPMLTGESAQDLGVRVLYNMPQPTHVQLWDGQRNILQKFTSAGWAGGKAATKYEKTVNLNRVKAELGFSAANYFSMVYEKVSSLVNTHMDDLSGTELEQAETALFKQALAENIRVTMWIGDTSAASGYNTFDGLLKRINGLVDDDGVYNFSYQAAALEDPAYAVELFDKLWAGADPRIPGLKADDRLAYFVSSDIYRLYEKYLDAKGADAAYADAMNGRRTLAYHGIPVVDVRLGSYLGATSFRQSFVMLTDRRNLVLAVNTADMPGNEVRMWYNPDEMENRQRAIFMAGCDYLLPELVSMAAGGFDPELVSEPVGASGGTLSVRIPGYSFIGQMTAQGVKADGKTDGDPVVLSGEKGTYGGTLAGTAIDRVRLTIELQNGASLEYTV